MAFFGLRLPLPMAQRFDAVAAGQGGRSAFLRALIKAAIDDPDGYDGLLARRTGLAVRRLQLRFTASELSLIDHAADAMSLTRAEWLTLLVRHRLQEKARPAARDIRALEAIRGELRRLGVRLAALEERAGGVTESEVQALRDEIRAMVDGVGAARLGDLAYWRHAR